MPTLKVQLPPSWSNQPAGPNGQLRYTRQSSTNPSLLEVSWVSYTGDHKKKPSFDDEGLIKLATKLATSSGGMVKSTNIGDCKLGRFGFVVSESERPGWERVWVIWNGSDCVLATQCGSFPPDKEELKEAEEIVFRMIIG